MSRDCDTVVSFIHGLLVALFWMMVNKNLFYNNLDLLQSSINDVRTQLIRNKQDSRHKVQVREAITECTECPKLVLKICPVTYTLTKVYSTRRSKDKRANLVQISENGTGCCLNHYLSVSGWYNSLALRN